MAWTWELVFASASYNIGHKHCKNYKNKNLLNEHCNRKTRTKKTPASTEEVILIKIDGSKMLRKARA